MGWDRASAVLSDLLKDFEIAAVPHGFHSSFRDWSCRLSRNMLFSSELYRVREKPSYLSPAAGLDRHVTASLRPVRPGELTARGAMAPPVRLTWSRDCSRTASEQTHARNPKALTCPRDRGNLTSTQSAS